MEKKIVYGLIGSGWRAEFYLRIAKALPEAFEVCGVVSRSENISSAIYNLNNSIFINSHI